MNKYQSDKNHLKWYILFEVILWKTLMSSIFLYNLRPWFDTVEQIPPVEKHVLDGLHVAQICLTLCAVRK